MKEEYGRLPYRPCVGVMLLNEAGKVWVGRRIPQWDGDGSSHMWQMPQGGIDEGETPLQAGLRELEEETGVNDCQFLAEYPGWLKYDLPEKALGKALGGKYRGQKQKWLAMRFLGDESDIDISGHNGMPPEFDQWKWVAIDALADLVVPFKAHIYRQLASHFLPLTRPQAEQTGQGG